MNSVITATECRLLQQTNSKVENEIVELLVTRFDKSIRAAAKDSKSLVEVFIPEFMFGMPAFNRQGVADSVKRIFENNGFRCTLESDHLTISWAITPEPDAHAPLVSTTFTKTEPMAENHKKVVKIL